VKPNQHGNPDRAHLASWFEMRLKRQAMVECSCAALRSFMFCPKTLPHPRPHHRYQKNTTFYVQGGPVFLLLGGEGPASPIWLSADTAVMSYAKKFNAAVYVLLLASLHNAPRTTHHAPKSRTQWHTCTWHAESVGAAINHTHPSHSRGYCHCFWCPRTCGPH
jgi:hypothetical protein